MHYVYDPSDDEEFEGGIFDSKDGLTRMRLRLKIKPDQWEEFKNKNNLYEKNGAFYKTCYIQDRGFKKWTEAADRAFNIIRWVGMIW